MEIYPFKNRQTLPLEKPTDRFLVRGKNFQIQTAGPSSLVSLYKITSPSVGGLNALFFKSIFGKRDSAFRGIPNVIIDPNKSVLLNAGHYSWLDKSEGVLL